MKTNRRSPWIAIVVAWEVVFLLSCRLAPTLNGDHEARHERSVVGVLLGESRTALSGHFYVIADKYFHKGAERVTPQVFRTRILQRALREISPEVHAHLGNKDVSQMMPWLWLAIRMNPRCVETYLVASFWLAGDIGRPDLALEVLRDAQQSIPFNYEIQLEKGRLLLRETKIEAAKHAFDAGLAFWPSGQDPQGEIPKHDKASLLLYRALLYEADGKKNSAVSALEDILVMFPERTHLVERVSELEQGTEPALLAPGLWEQMLKTETLRRKDKACPSGHPHGDEQGHAEEHGVHHKDH
jgi:tetratricopeptide (TPR) repeat protein